MTDINELPDAVFIKVLGAKNLPTEFDPESGTLPTPEVIANMKAALETARRQWKALFKDMTHSQIKGTRNVNVSRAGFIRLTGSGAEVAVAMSSRTVDKRWITKRLPNWLAVNESSRYLTLAPNDTAGTIRRKAFDQYLRDAYADTLRVSKADTYSISTLSDIFVAVEQLANKDNMIRLARKAIGKATSLEREVKRHDSTPQFNQFMDKKRRQMQDVALLATGQPTIDTLTIPVKRTKASRTWGIEVESGGARYAETPAGWSRKRDGSLRSAYRNGDLIDNNAGVLAVQGDDTAEFVSPILRSFHSNGLRQITEQLSREPQNTSAGVHVHVGADGLTPKQLGGLVYAYQIIEPLITESYKREVRDYCRERDTRQVLSVIRSAKSAENVTTGLEHGDRYHSVNLQALYAHGTVEFRAMGPVYNYEHLIRWASFCREMVNLAASDVPAKVWAAVKGWDDVLAIFAKYGTETPNYVIDAMEAKLTRAEERELV